MSHSDKTHTSASQWGIPLLTPEEVEREKRWAKLVIRAMVTRAMLAMYGIATAW